MGSPQVEQLPFNFQGAVLRLSAARFLAWLITFSTIASIPKAALERRGFRPIILVII
ncbi:hypothetical protein [Nostoc sp.]|uniref:hypothetical protein n=1 Tax=Nostoc sp. TaxID=1180 RepID=UPI002FF7476D